MGLTLYSRSDCGLCDEAAELLELAGLSGQYQVVDIDTDLTLIQRYGTRIPVLMDASSRQTLNWPFTASQVKALINDCND